MIKKIYIDPQYLPIKEFFDSFDKMKITSKIIRERKLCTLEVLNNSFVPSEIKPVLVKKFYTYRLKPVSFGKMLRKEHALYAYRAAKQLNKAGRHLTPHIYAAVLYKQFFFHHHSLQFQEYLEHSQNFKDYYQNLKEEAEKVLSVKLLAELLADIHKRKIYLIDVHLKNVLIKEDKLFITDLDASFIGKGFLRLFSGIFKIFDLNCLARSLRKISSAEICQKFYSAYAQHLNWSKRKTKFMYNLLNKSFFR